MYFDKYNMIRDSAYDINNCAADINILNRHYDMPEPVTVYKFI